jgi:CubicO group peptidase (beta-lactamase class C family)
MTRTCAVLLMALAAAPGGAARASSDWPSPRFADPDRARTLATAYPEIERLFADRAARAHIPGAAFGIVVDGELVFAKGIGLRDVATQAPADPDTVFRIASMTKSFTALSILRLRDDGKLSLDDPAAKYVPELAALRYPTSDSPPITIRHLLTHSEGFPEDNPWGDRQLAASDEQFSRGLAAGIPFSNPPGLAFEYSNTGFAILGRIVARVSGMRYRDYVDRHVLGPLGMTATIWDVASAPPGRIAKGYRRDGETWVEEALLPDGAFGAMGGLSSTVRDLARYTAFFLSAWPPRDDPETGPIRRSSAREMQQEWRTTPAFGSRETVESPLRLGAGAYGYGLGVSQSCRFRHVVAHSGGLPGFGSQMRWLPDYGVAIVALGNLTYASWGGVVGEAFEALHRTGALKPRVTQPSPALLTAQESVDRLLARWDDRVADGLAADNLDLDVPRERRRRSFEELRSVHGACRPGGPIEAENALRGQWTLACSRGAIRVAITLAPTVPPRVQALETTSIPALGERMQHVVKRLAGLTSRFEAAALAEIAAPGAERSLRTTLTAAAPWGSCRPGEARSGDGDAQAVIGLECERGRLHADVALDKGSGRLRTLRLAPPSDETCVP